MTNNEEEDVKVIKFDNNDDQKKLSSINEEEDQKNNNNKSDKKTENPNENSDKNKIPIKKKTSKLKVQRTKAPKVFLKEQKKEKKGGFGLFSCCLPSNKDDDEDE